MSEEQMNLSTLTRGSMRSRSTSDKRSEDKGRTNEPREVHLQLRTRPSDEDRVGLPIKPAKFRGISFFLQLSLVGPRLKRRGAEKVITLLTYKNWIGGRQKGARRIYNKGQRTTWYLNSPLVAYTYRRTRASRSYQQRPEVPIKGPECQEVISKGQSA